MKIQSITPTGNLKSKNCSFKAKLVHNAQFCELWLKEPLAKNKKFYNYADTFITKNVGHCLEICSINKNKAAGNMYENVCIEILNRSNGIRKKYENLSSFDSLTELLGKLCSDEKIYKNAPSAAEKEISTNDTPQIFVDNKYYKELRSRANRKNIQGFNELINSLNKTKSGHRLEIINCDYASFGIGANKPVEYTYSVFNHRTGATSSYSITGLDGYEHKELLNKIRYDSHLFDINSRKAKCFMKLTGQI